MFSFLDGRSPPKARRGPKPRGRKVKPLTIAVTTEQRLALEALADARGSSISEVVRQFITHGLAAVAIADATHNGHDERNGHDGHAIAGVLGATEILHLEKPA